MQKLVEEKRALRRENPPPPIGNDERDSDFRNNGNDYDRRGHYGRGSGRGFNSNYRRRENGGSYRRRSRSRSPHESRDDRRGHHHRRDSSERSYHRRDKRDQRRSDY